MFTRLPLVPRILMRMSVCTVAFLYMWHCALNQPHAAPRPDAVGSPAYVAAHHDCWNDGGAHPVPAHAVMQIVYGNGSGTVSYVGKRITNIGLAHIGQSFMVHIPGGKVTEFRATILYYCV